MSKKVIVIDPGHGGTAKKDYFRAGATGEREEWINLRVCQILAKLLEKNNIDVYLTRKKDIEVTLSERVQFCSEKKADLFLSVHHASCDPVIGSINFPFIYMHKSLDSEVKSKLALSFQKEMSKAGHGPALIYSDHWVFDEGLFVLRELDKLKTPSVLSEFSFFSHPEEEIRLKSNEYCSYEAEIFLNSILQFFSIDDISRKKNSADFPLDYKKQLNLIKEALIENGEGESWHKFIAEAESLYDTKNWQQALVVYEKALSLNPYFPQILVHLQKMIKCTEKLKAEEYKENLLRLQKFVW